MLVGAARQDLKRSCYRPTKFTVYAIKMQKRAWLTFLEVATSHVSSPFTFLEFRIRWLSDSHPSPTRGHLRNARPGFHNIIRQSRSYLVDCAAKETT